MSSKYVRSYLTIGLVFLGLVFATVAVSVIATTVSQTATTAQADDAPQDIELGSFDGSLFSGDDYPVTDCANLRMYIIFLQATLVGETVHTLTLQEKLSIARELNRAKKYYESNCQ